MSQYTVEQFNQAFLASTPDIAAEILDYTYKSPRWMADLYEVAEWSSDQNVQQQLVWRGALPEIERGFDKWKRLADAAGCQPCLDDCSYNWTQFAGSGFERRMVQLMRREFRTDKFCVNEIRNTHEYELVFNKHVENINQQVAYFKEQNIGFNFLTGIAQKLLVDGGGIKGNTQDPYTYRPIGTATLSKLNTTLLSSVYEGMRRRIDVQPFDIVDGKPLYAISASDEVMDALYLEDANARADLRFSSAADATLTRYNFMSSVRGQFINAPLLYPRRFKVVSGVWTEVFPKLDGIPAEVGSFSDLNPAYEEAPYEEVLIYGRAPFKLFYRSPITTLGSNSEFGPEPTFMNSWMWVNIPTEADPFRREGFYATSAEIALSPQFSGGVYGLIVPRPPRSLVAQYWPANVCPPVPVDCDNEVPAVTCPCPFILSAVANPVTAGRYFITFGVPVTGVVGGTIQLGIDTGGYLTGTITAIAADGLTAEVTFGAGVVITDCRKFTTVFCDNTLGCSADVLSTSDCRAGETGEVKLVLSNPIKADTAGDVITAYMGDGSVQSLQVISVDMTSNTWVVEYAAGSGPTDDPTGAGTTELEDGLVCDRNGVVRVCVPPSTDATCPACGGGSIVPCES